MFTCVLACVASTVHISSTGTFRSALTASLDSFSGVTKYGRVWRKVPESDARSVPVTLSHSRLGTKLKENRTEETSWSGKFKLHFGGSVYIHAKELVLFFRFQFQLIRAQPCWFPLVLIIKSRR